MGWIIPKKAVDEALAELGQASEYDIERETAIKWGARALAAYSLYEEFLERHWLLSAEEYYHEAVEHAALIFDHGETARQIQLQIAPVRQRALKARK